MKKITFKKMNTVNLMKMAIHAFAVLAIALILSQSVAVPVFAANEYAENAAKWILDGLFWVVVVAGIAGAAMMAVKRNLTGALMVVLGTIIACVFIQNPNLIGEIGNKLKTVIF